MKLKLESLKDGLILVVFARGMLDRSTIIVMP